MNRFYLGLIASSALALLIAAPALAQPGPPPPGPPPGSGGPRITLDDVIVQNGPASEGRGAPIPPIGDVVGADAKGLGDIPNVAANALAVSSTMVASALNGETPEGIEPLERDIFNSDDFYADRDLWTNPLYYRCNSSWGIEGVWGAYGGPNMGDDPPRTAPWGYCDRDYPRENIVSPYPYDTAQAHYEALLAEATSRGGPTVYSRENPPPDWDGSYTVGFNVAPLVQSNWFEGSWMQVPNYLSLLTPEYQERFVQQVWHNAHNQNAWPSAYCMPAGFSRRFFPFGGRVIVSPNEVVFMKPAGEPVISTVTFGREFKMDGSVPYLSQDVRKWYGETIGFWDGDVLITWSSNIRGWLSHGTFEFSDEMQSVEIWTPMTDKDGKFVGLMWDAILYDPEAFVEPLRITTPMLRTGTLAEDTFAQNECIQNLWPIGNSTQVPVSAGTTIEYTVLPAYDRPWASIWAPFEAEMQKPEEGEVPAFN